MTPARAALPAGLGLGLGLSALVSPAAPLAWVVSGCVGLTALTVPALALAAVALAQLTPELFVSSGAAAPPVSAAKLAGGLLLASVVLSRHRSRLWRRTPLDAPLLIIACTAALAAVFSPVPARSAQMLTSLLLLLALPRLVHAALPRPSSHLLLTRTLTVALLALVVMELVHRAHLLRWGVPADAWSLRSAAWMRDPNLWAASLVLWAPTLLSALRDEPPAARHLGRGALLALIPAGIWLTGSRAGLIAWALTLPGQLWLLGAPRRTGPALLLTGAVAAGVALQLGLAPRLAALLDPSLEITLGEGALRDRVNLLRSGLQGLPHALPWGLGLGASLRESAALTAGDAWKVLHNTPLTILLEQGVLGFTAWLLLVATALRHAWRTQAHPLSAAFLATAPGLLFLSLTLELAHFGPAWLALGLTLTNPAPSATTAALRDKPR